MDTTKDYLIRMCNRFVEEIESGEYAVDDDEDFDGPCAGHYLDDALDFRYTVSRELEYLGARICVSFGGPNIFINTLTKTVEGFWGSDSVERVYNHDALGLDDYLEELFDCLR